MAKPALLTVRVTPRAGRDEVAGWRDGELRVRLRAPPVEGQANEALVRFVASLVGVAPRDVQIVSGARGRSKRLRVTGVTQDELLARLQV